MEICDVCKLSSERMSYFIYLQSYPEDIVYNICHNCWNIIINMPREGIHARESFLKALKLEEHPSKIRDNNMLNTSFDAKVGELFNLILIQKFLVVLEETNSIERKELLLNQLTTIIEELNENNKTILLKQLERIKSEIKKQINEDPGIAVWDNHGAKPI